MTLLWVLVGARIGSASEPAPPDAAPALVAVVHAATPDQGTSMAKQDLRKMLTGARRFWPKRGGPVVVVMLDHEAPASVALFEQVLGMPAGRFEALWTRLELSGQGVAPREASSVSEMLRLVAGTPGALGYALRADVGAAPDDVKVLAIE